MAVAGRNGVGKSTLFHLIRGTLQPDSGELTMPARWRIGYMEQEVEVTSRPAREYVLDGDAELRRIEAELADTEDTERLARLHMAYDDIGGYTAQARGAAILSGLGFASADFDKPFSAFSGGWRIRLNLARALMCPCDLLLLDEPTNHLDLEAIMWLESWLRQFEGTVIFIAHDRAFLDACADHTLFLAGTGGEMYSGNYSACERQRAERATLVRAMQAKRDAQVAHMQQFIDRFRAKESKARQVQSRIKALERLTEITAVHVDSPYSVAFQDPDKVSNPILSANDLVLGYDDKPVLHNIGFTLLPGARIGVLGANGAGKTTLLKGLVGELQPLAGEIVRGRHAEVGYFAQHQLESLDSGIAALTSLQRLRPAWREQQCRDFLGRWGFDTDMVSRPIATLSGGEKARLVLAGIALDKPAVLVLDEPTNHLDLDMRDALALALQDYAGAVVIVSHDRVLLDECVDEFWVIADGTMTAYQGDLADYTTSHGRNALPASDETIGAEAESKKQQRKLRADQRASVKHLRDRVSELERELDAAATRLAEVEGVLADTDTYQSLPAEELDELLAKAGRYRSRLEMVEEQWLEATTDLEQAQPAGD